MGLNLGTEKRQHPYQQKDPRTKAPSFRELHICPPRDRMTSRHQSPLCYVGSGLRSTVFDINPALPLYKRTLNYGNDGMFEITGNAGFRSSTVGFVWGSGFRVQGLGSGCGASGARVQGS